MFLLFFIPFPRLITCLFILLLPGFLNCHVRAINRCSHALNYRDLCPSPLYASTSNSVPDTNMKINLTRQGNGSCEFFKSKDEAVVVAGFHVLDHAWTFHKGKDCKYVVKVGMDNYLRYGMRQHVCNKELGMKIQEGVYFWHNFTLFSDHFSYEDLISNYGHSPMDLQCTHHGTKFALLMFLTSRDHQCNLIVQQYRIDTGANGCNLFGASGSPQSHRFCGVYSCSNINIILHELKLIGRRKLIEITTTNPFHFPQVEEKKSKEDETTTEESTHKPMLDADGNEILKREKPIDWVEWTVRLIFPFMGIVFIVGLFFILKGRNMAEICGAGSASGYNVRNPCPSGARGSMSSMMIDINKAGGSYRT